MSKMQILLFVGAVFIVIVLIIIILYPKIEQGNREKELQKNETLFLNIINYLDDLEYEYISTSNYYSFYASSGIGGGTTIQIEDEQIKNDLREILIGQNYLFIEKEKAGIRFVKAGFLDNTSGYVYLFSGGKPQGFRTNTFIKLSKDCWYWYSEH